MKKFILKNGLPVLLYKMPNTHSITIGLYVRAGVGYKTESFTGISHLLEHLHFRRMGQISQKELYYKMESIGSTLRAATYRDFIKFTMKIVPQNLEACIAIFCQLFTAFEWTNEEMEKEKQVVLNQIYEKEAYTSMNKIIHEVVFQKHNLAEEIMGSVDSVSKIQISDIIKYKKEVFNSQNLLLCITGNIDDSTFYKAAKQLETISISKEYPINILDFPRNFHRRKQNIIFIPIQDENFLDVNLSFDISYDKKDREFLVLLNCILGEGVGSKLQSSIREDLDVSLPFYTTNRAFYEDDTEEMNFQLAYHVFVLKTEFGKFNIENNTDTISKLKYHAKELFTQNNISIVIVGNTKGITKKAIRGLIDFL